MRALITGANGMLGSALCPLLYSNGYEILPTDINIMDSEMEFLDVRELDKIKLFINKKKPDIVFHLAAETDVDKCELNKEHAFLVNAKGTENVAVCCKDSDIPLVYVSTGAVFDGEKIGGYTEQDIPNPISVYGLSKLEGENTVSSLLSKFYIIRAGWMIGGHNKDKKFVWKIIQLLNNSKEISVVVDKIGSPTFTKDFAKGMIDIVSTGKYGVYHCVNEGICTRFDIAKKIVEFLNKKDVIIKPVTSDAFLLPAPRGKSEALINYNLSLLGINNMKPWQDALREYIREIA